MLSNPDLSVGNAIESLTDDLSPLLHLISKTLKIQRIKMAYSCDLFKLRFEEYDLVFSTLWRDIFFVFKCLQVHLLMKSGCIT